MPSIDFGDVAARIAAGLSGIRACLVVSRDGLTLGAYPADAEERGREVWDLLEQVGDVTRGFVEMGMEMWVLARRGPYGAIVVASPDVRPGLVLDRIEANLVVAEQARAKQAVEEPAPVPRPEPVRRPRSPLHPEPRLDAPEPVPKEEVPESEEPPKEDQAAPVVDLSRVPDHEPAAIEAVSQPEADPAPEPMQANMQPQPDPVPEPIQANTQPEPDPVPQPVQAHVQSNPEPAAEPAHVSFEPVHEVMKPREEPVRLTSAPAAAGEPAHENVPTFQPASTPEPQVGEVFVAGVSTTQPPIPQPQPPSVPAAEAEPSEETSAKKPARRRFRRKSGEVDRVALAREFGDLMKDEFGV